MSKSLMMPVEEVAEMLAMSARNVYRLADGGQMPRKIKIGGAVRWRRAEIEDWIAAGCPKNASGYTPSPRYAGSKQIGRRVAPSPER